MTEMICKYLRISRGLCLFFVFFSTGCEQKWINPFEEDATIDPCDPTSSVYTGNRHFIERDFLKDDGTLNYRKLMQARDVGNSSCDPLHRKGH